MTNRQLVFVIIVFMLSNAILSIALIKERREHTPCQCDTCCEFHWEQIRTANPHLRMEAL